MAPVENGRRAKSGSCPRALIVAACLLLCCGARAALAEGTEFRGKFEGQLALKIAPDLKWVPENEDVWTNDFYAYAAASGAWGPNYSAFASGLFEYRYSVGEEAHAEPIPELRELYGKVRLGKLDVFFGQQIVSWAVSDFSSPMDQLNPYDYRRVMDLELPYYRLGTVMIRPIVYVGPVQFEAVYLPLFTPARYNIVGPDWALVGQGFPLGELVHDLRRSNQWKQFEAFVAHWVPEWRDDVKNALSDPEYYRDRTDVPDQDLTAPEAAARIKYTSSAIDVSAAGYWLWDDLPTLHINPRLRELEKTEAAADAGFPVIPAPEVFSTSTASEPFALTHHRVPSVGLGLAGAIEGVALRAEAAADFGRYYYFHDLAAVRRDELRWAANVDYTFPYDVFVEGILLQSYLFDREVDMIQRAWTHKVGVVVRTSFLDDKLKLEAAGLVDLSTLNGRDWRRGDVFAGSWFAAPILTYSITDPLRVSVGANLLGGDEDTLIGSLQGNSRAFAELRYGF